MNSKEQRNEKKNKEYKGKRLKRFVIPNPRGGTVMLGGGGNPALSDFREKTEAISVSGRVILRSDEMSRKSKGLPLWRKPFLFVLLWAVPAAAT